MRKRRFFCDHCGTSFATESGYLKHKCEQMKRMEEIQTPLGQAAFLFYQNWMRAQKRLAPSSDTFLRSNYYKTFNRFASFVKRVRLPQPEKFIRLMVKKDFPPVMWEMDQVYSLYLEHIDHLGDPLSMASLTIQNLFDLAEDHECDISEVFNHTPSHDIIHLVRTRQLSPWILLHSKKFFSFLLQETSSEERIILEALIRPEAWKQRFSKKPEMVSKMRLFVSEMEL